MLPDGCVKCKRMDKEKRMDTFSGYHPLINFTYFVIVIGLSMFYMHPVFLALSLIGR